MCHAIRIFIERNCSLGFVSVYECLLHVKELYVRLILSWNECDNARKMDLGSSKCMNVVY